MEALYRNPYSFCGFVVFRNGEVVVDLVDYEYWMELCDMLDRFYIQNVSRLNAFWQKSNFY